MDTDLFHQQRCVQSLPGLDDDRHTCSHCDGRDGDFRHRKSLADEHNNSGVNTEVTGLLGQAPVTSRKVKHEENVTRIFGRTARH